MNVIGNGQSYVAAYTLPETKIAPEDRQSQKETSIPTSNHLFLGAMLVSGSAYSY